MFCPSVTEDNQPYPLPWLLPDPPQPINPTSRYMYVTCLGGGNCFFHALLRAIHPLYIRSYNLPDTITEQEIKEYETAIDEKLNFASGTLEYFQGTFIIKDKWNFAQTMREYRIKLSCKYRRVIAEYIRTNDEAKRIIERYFKDAILDKVEEIRENYKSLSDEELFSKAVDIFAEGIAQEISAPGLAIPPDVMILLSDIHNIDIYMLSETNLLNPKALHPFVSVFHHVAVRGPKDMRKENLDEPERKSVVMMYSGGVEGHYEVIARIDQLPTGPSALFQMDSNEPLIRRLFSYLVRLR